MAHSSLGFNSYVHATSPIRRYTDLVVQRQIIQSLTNKVTVDDEALDEVITTRSIPD